MKFSVPSLAALSFALPALACLRVHGGITHDPLGGQSGIYGVEAIDNGVVTCSGGASINSAGNYEMTCIAGYAYSFTMTGGIGYYRNPSTLFQFIQNAESTTYDCGGACLDHKGACIQCTDYNWDVTNYC